MPDEEKEKIGPKPATNRRAGAGQITSPDGKISKQVAPLPKQTQGATLKSAPVPQKPLPPKPNPAPPPQQPPIAMTPIPPPPGMIPQNPMMMMAPIRQPIMGNYLFFFFFIFLN